MPFSAISSAAVQVGKAITAGLFGKVRTNLDDHEARLAALETSSSLVPIFDETVYNVSAAASLTGVIFHKVTVAVRITKVQVQIFEKGSIVSGLLTVDAKKAATLGAVFSSILTAGASLNYATAANYDSADATINSSLNSLSVNQFLRIDVTALPTVPVGKFRILVYGELV